jgi:hypothetical protein
MGRPKLFAETVLVRLTEGTRERIDAVLTDGEDRTDLIRAAIGREIARRAKARR